MPPRRVVGLETLGAFSFRGVSAPLFFPVPVAIQPNYDSFRVLVLVSLGLIRYLLGSEDSISRRHTHVWVKMQSK
jgi:hypothetical protein